MAQRVRWVWPMHIANTVFAVVLVLTALTPRAVEAQAGGGLDSPVEQATPHFELDPEIAAMRARTRADRPAPYQAVRLPIPQLELEPVDTAPNLGSSFGHAWAGLGIGMGGGALIGAVVTGAAVCPGETSGLCPLFVIAGAGLGAFTFAPLGAALATWGFGDRRGGTGNFFAALGGAYLGAGVGVGVAALIASIGTAESLALSFVGPLVGVMLTTLGAAAGYQLSSHGTREEAERAEGLVVVPTLNPIENGATVGIAGMF